MGATLGAVVVPGGQALNALDGLSRFVAHCPAEVADSLVVGHLTEQGQGPGWGAEAGPEADVGVGVAQALEKQAADSLGLAAVGGAEVDAFEALAADDGVFVGVGGAFDESCLEGLVAGAGVGVVGAEVVNFWSRFWRSPWTRNRQNCGSSMGMA